MFEYTRPDGGVSNLRFSMEWYNPSNGTWNGESEGNPSGAYLFKPKIGDQNSHAYSRFHTTEVLVGSRRNSLASEIVMHFKSDLRRTD